MKKEHDGILSFDLSLTSDFLESDYNYYYRIECKKDLINKCKILSTLKEKGNIDNSFITDDVITLPYDIKLITEKSKLLDGKPIIEEGTKQFIDDYNYIPNLHKVIEEIYASNVIYGSKDFLRSRIKLTNFR